MPDTLVKRNASIVDTIKLILLRINTDVHSEFVKQLAMQLHPGGDQLAYMRRLFDFVCRNVKYQLDKEGKEDVYRPSTTIVNGKGDCKKMTVIIASVLKAVGIEPYIKHVFYNGENYTHVYVIVPYPNLKNYIVLDPVNDCKFNEEVSYLEANIFDLKGNRMDLYTGYKKPTNPGFMDHLYMGAKSIEDDMNFITGCSCSTMGANQSVATFNQIFEESISGDPIQTGKKHRSKEERKKKRQELLHKITNVVKKVGVAPTRGAFLVLVRMNVLKLASQLAAGWNKDPKAIEDLWTGLGGNVDELKKTIVAGSGQNVSGMGQGVAAVIATATPIILAVLAKLKKLGVVKEGDKVDDLVNEAVDTASDNVSDGTIPEDELARQKPDSGTHVVKDINKVVTQAPTDETKNLLQAPTPPPTNPPTPAPIPTPVHGSFVSVFGIFFKTPLLLGAIFTAPTGIVAFLISLVNLYCIVGIVLLPWIVKEKVKWYVDVPVKIFYSVFEIPKKIIFNSLKKIKLKNSYHG